MKTPILMFFALAGLAVAEIPKKTPLHTYARLWSPSPFTIPPAAPGGPVAVNPFEDWSLGGVSQLADGYMITLFNTKKAGESMVITPKKVTRYLGDKIEVLLPSDPAALSVAKVERGKNSWKETVVTLSSAGRTGIVKFNEKDLLPKSGAVVPPGGNRQGQVPGAPPGVPGANGAQPVPGQVPNQGQQGNNNDRGRGGRVRSLPPGGGGR